MQKEIKVILDTDEARKGLFIHTDFVGLHKDSDEEIAEKAINHVEQFASKFGFSLAPEKPALNADVKKPVTVKVNTKVARTMLGIAGYHGLDQKSDEEIFAMAMDMVTCYGVSYEESVDHDGTA